MPGPAMMMMVMSPVIAQAGGEFICSDASAGICVESSEQRGNPISILAFKRWKRRKFFGADHSAPKTPKPLGKFTELSVRKFTVTIIFLELNQCLSMAP